MDEFELEDNLELLLQSIQELIEDQGENNPFGAANHDELIASLLHNNQVRRRRRRQRWCFPIAAVAVPHAVELSFCLFIIFCVALQENPLTDVSVEDVRDGKDMQGIPWEKIVFRRDQYREMKMKNYRNYQNLSYAREEALKVPCLCSWTILLLFVESLRQAMV
jgi:hypothetical protein